MLRHCRGMLQIVPHGDLGAVTNFMCGGDRRPIAPAVPLRPNIVQGAAAGAAEAVPAKGRAS
jgi:hypothetical protein